MNLIAYYVLILIYYYYHYSFKNTSLFVNYYMENFRCISNYSTPLTDTVGRAYVTVTIVYASVSFTQRIMN